MFCSRCGKIKYLIAFKLIKEWNELKRWPLTFVHPYILQYLGNIIILFLLLYYWVLVLWILFSFWTLTEAQIIVSSNHNCSFWICSVILCRIVTFCCWGRVKTCGKMIHFCDPSIISQPSFASPVSAFVLNHLLSIFTIFKSVKTPNPFTSY